MSGLHSVTADDDSFEQPLGSDWGSFSRRFDIPGRISLLLLTARRPQRLRHGKQGDRAGR
ncbi:MAG: hypothetical protein R2856_09640 [Caldilineaceae bacterium]